MAEIGIPGIGKASLSAEASNTKVTNTGLTTTEANQLQKLLFDPTAKAALDKALSGEGYDKETAIADSKASADYVMQILLEKNASAISSDAKAAGGYNSTEQARQGNDLTARVGAAGQQVLLDTITKYATIRQGDVNAATGAVNATTNKEVVTTQAVAENKTQNTQSRKGGTVICTQLFKDGVISYEALVADYAYARKHFSATTVAGYHLWAIPLVAAMVAGNPIAVAVGTYIGTHWSRYCNGDITLTGRVLRVVLAPTCNVLGHLVAAVAAIKEMGNGNRAI